MRYILTVVTLVLLTYSAYGSSKECLNYEPAIVELIGTIEMITYPGPPNYEDIKGGDIPEVSIFLFLEAPICVNADPKSELNAEAEVNQSRIQLVPSDSVHDLKKYANGKRYRIGGRLFHWHTAHHRAPILVIVQRVEGIN